MTEEQKQAITESGKSYFRTSIMPNHIKNLQKTIVGVLYGERVSSKYAVHIRK